MKIGIVGAGLQARRRIPAINAEKSSKVVAITAKTLEKAQELGEKYSLEVVKNWQTLINNPHLDAIVVTTYPDSHAEITLAALKAGKHVLCEKPLARNLEEAKKMIQVAKETNKILKCGFNHRFHPAVQGAKQLIDEGKIGNLLFGRGVYGYCGRPGFEKEWRSDTRYSAGGILMEQGIHLIDLARWFFGEFKKVSCFSDTLYWPIAPFEDSAMVFMQTKNKQMVTIHATNLQWENTFLFEVYGTEGYVRVEGLGRSYGTEKLVFGKKNYSGPFQEEVVEYRGEDVSWKKEWEEFIKAINKKQEPLGNGEDGVKAMRLVEASYESAKKGRVISL